jgi:hypothetical protein
MSSIFQNLDSIKQFVLSFGEIAGSLLIGVLIGVVGAVRKRKINLKWNTSKERTFVEKHSRIHEQLTELRVMVRASRCLVFQFHNGGSFADGVSIKRFSVTHESCEAGVTSMILESQDVLLTRYIELVQTMKDAPHKILPVSSLAPSSFRSGLEINSVEYFSVSPLQCSDSLTPIGFVCCHWCSADKLDEIEKEGIAQTALEQLIGDSVRNINSYFWFKAGRKQ